MPPTQALLQEDLVDPAALDRDVLLVVEVGLQAIQRPAAEGQIQALGVAQSLFRKVVLRVGEATAMHAFLLV